MATSVGRLGSEPVREEESLLVGMFGISRKRYRGESGNRELGDGCIPSHLANSSREMGSSFGGSSWTGTLGAKRSDIVVVVIVEEDG
jgi:hypothetical protein